MIDLYPRHLQAILAIADATLPANAKILAYGSRVNGTAHDTSDLDLVIKTPQAQPLPAGRLHAFTEALRDSNVPIIVEVLDWHTMPEYFKPGIEKQHHVLREAKPQ